MSSALASLASAVPGQILDEALTRRIGVEIEQAADSLAKLQAFEPSVDPGVVLSKEQVGTTLDELWVCYRAAIDRAEAPFDLALGELPPPLAELRTAAEGGRPAIEVRELTVGEHRMPFALVRREAGLDPDRGRPLFLCMHGGGRKGDATGPHAWDVNTREFEVQTKFACRLYRPPGVYFVPRMADDRLGRWWHAHNQDAFEEVIRHAIADWGVDPDRVYLLGISEGGYGTDILAPFMPDLFAAANPMAAGVGLGNPAENLRNLPFRTEVGAEDRTYDRVGLARAFHTRLDELRAGDVGGYEHVLHCQEGRGHGIDYRPGVAWMAQFTRRAHPERVVWTSKVLDGRRRRAMYWIELEGPKLEGTIRITAMIDRTKNAVLVDAHQLGKGEFKGNPSHLQSEDAAASPLTNATIGIDLSDDMLDLDRRVTVTVNGNQVFDGVVERRVRNLLRTLVRRGDRSLAFPARIEVHLDAVEGR